MCICPAESSKDEMEDKSDGIQQQSLGKRLWKNSIVNSRLKGVGMVLNLTSGVLVSKCASHPELC